MQFMSDPVITLAAIRKSYQDIPVLEIPHLSLGHGIYWLKGENGAGKTTCMKVMAGLLPFKGDIIINGTVNNAGQPVAYRRLINYAEAEPLYPAFLTGKDLINLYLNTKGGDPQTMQEIQSLLGVDNFVNNPVSSYSSGMLKKLSLMLAFTGTPAIILLDEPLITIDTRTVATLYELINRYHHLGVTFCITSHQPLDPAKVTINGTLTIHNRNITLN